MCQSCPNCQAPLPEAVVAKGKCDVCGMKLAAALFPLRVGPALNSPSPPLGPRRISISYMAGGALLVALGVLMFWTLTTTEFREKTMRNTRNGSIFTKSVTEQKIEAGAAGLFMIGAGGYLGWRGLTRRGKPQTS